MEELVKMSPKGQLVVPKDIREKEKFSPSDRFVAVGINGGVVFKRISIPDVKIEFQSLSKEIAKKFKENKIKKQDVKEAVKWARK
tara:strand:- start:519 stop:773 length:255 start_codon:yes stop_codon:yes gene_type:complete